MEMIFACMSLLLILTLGQILSSDSFSFTAITPPRISSSALLAKKQSRSSVLDPKVEDEEKPADIVGSAFFGGAKQKEELYDPVAEAGAGTVDQEFVAVIYDRFKDAKAFHPEVAKLAASLQSQINAALYEGSPAPMQDFTYSSSMAWETPMARDKGSKTPLKELETALEFYKTVDVAVVSGEKISDNTVKLQWEVSLAWPIFWEARVLLTGFSTLVLDGSSIVKQVDSLNDSKDVLSTVASQITPRFWDVYHIGMTPCAELMPRLNQKDPLFGGYSVFEIPGRLVATPTQLDVGEREDRNAQTLPNHAFSCVIKTMGPQRQRFVPASPVQIQIVSGGEKLKLKWSIPLSVEFQTTMLLPLPGEDEEAQSDSNPESTYEFQSRRKVATIKYGGDPQDVEITDIRKKLYEQVVKDGLKPKMDEKGRPQFFFLQNGVKACYTEEGLGMCVYEWRPASVKPNEVGIELEL
jgi:hypothetical protein